MRIYYVSPGQETFDEPQPGWYRDTEDELIGPCATKAEAMTADTRSDRELAEDFANIRRRFSGSLAATGALA